VIAAADKIVARVEEACGQSMRMRKTNRRHHTLVFWWSEDIALQRIISLRATRLVQRARGTTRLEACHTEYKVTKNSPKKTIRASNRECFLKVCVAAESDPSALENIFNVLFLFGLPFPIPRSGQAETNCGLSRSPRS